MIPISGALTVYTDANNSGKTGYKSEDISKVVKNPCESG